MAHTAAHAAFENFLYFYIEIHTGAHQYSDEWALPTKRLPTNKQKRYWMVTEYNI